MGKIEEFLEREGYEEIKEYIDLLKEIIHIYWEYNKTLHLTMDMKDVKRSATIQLRLMELEKNIKFA